MKMNQNSQSRTAGGAGRLLGAIVLTVALGLSTGCNSLLDPSELTQNVGRPRGSGNPLTVPILERLDPGLEREQIEFADASLPSAEDLRAPLGDYGISRNDVLTISVSDIQAPGIETTKQTRVSETGNISLPYIGQIRAEGLTEIELERAIIKGYAQARLVDNANVSVQVFESRGRAYSITGAVRSPNVYAIPEADYRVLNALTAAGETTSPFNRTLYIIRRLDERPRPAVAPESMGPAGNPGTGAPGTGTPGTGPGTPGTGADDLAPRPRSEGNPFEDNQARAAASPRGRTRVLNLMTQAQPQDDERIINLDGQELPARRPESDDAAGRPRTPAPGTGAAGRPATRTGSAAGSQTGASGGTMSAPGDTRRATGSSGSFEFNDLAPPPETRIIRIPLDDLRKGDLKYNIVIRPRDTLVVPYAEVGTYYMGGHVGRPGAYSLNGQRVTLMDAIIAASMLDQLAIPQRTDLVRRIGPDQQVFVRVDLAQIFAGNAPDIYLKPDDKILVGTNAIAPFLSAVRNSFRFTYGAGFIYDRNFAYPRRFLGGVRR